VVVTVTIRNCCICFWNYVIQTLGHGYSNHQKLLHLLLELCNPDPTQQIELLPVFESEPHGNIQSAINISMLMEDSFDMWHEVKEMEITE
jgi:hypothetical protein